MSRLVRRLLVWIAVVVVVVCLIAVASWRRELTTPYKGWEGERAEVVLEGGLDAGSMLRRLQQAGVIEDPLPLRIWLSWKGGSGELHAGEYRFTAPATPLEVLSRLRSGDVLLHTVTLPEGLVLEETAERLADAGFATVEEFLALFRSPAQLNGWDSEAVDLEGYLFPETYSFPRGATATKITQAMIERFRDVTGEEYRAAAKRVGLTLREAVTLASLIEKETGLPEERARISRVFHNRLDRGMLLQCDPTVRYALFRAGKPVGKLTYKHLEFDSPWNTYVTPGLPPGPIANPGEASLRAAVHPADGDELYFVAAPGGGHRFTTNLEAHLEAVREWRNYLRSSR
jgi:UPF0755 protein